MSRLIRKYIYLAPEQDAALTRRARELGVSEQELVMHDIELVAPVTTETDRRLQAWDQIAAFIASYDQLDVPQTGRDWTRDELNDDRLRRYSG